MDRGTQCLQVFLLSISGLALHRLVPQGVFEHSLKTAYMQILTNHHMFGRKQATRNILQKAPMLQICYRYTLLLAVQLHMPIKGSFGPLHTHHTPSSGSGASHCMAWTRQMPAAH